MNDNNLNSDMGMNNLQGGVNNMPNPNSGVVPTMDNTTMNQGVAPTMGNTTMNQGVAPTMGNTTMNQGMAPAMDSTTMNQGMAPAMGTTTMNQGVAPAMDNTTMNQGNVQPPKKKSSVLTIVIIILLLAIVGVGGFYAYKMFFNNGGNKVDVDSGNTNSAGTGETTNTTEDESVATTIEAGKTVTVNGYTYSVPSDLYYQIKDDVLYVGDDVENPTYLIDFVPTSGLYNMYKDNIEELKKKFTDSGATIEETEVVNIGNREYILMAMVYNNVPEVLAITNLNEKTVMIMDIIIVDEIGLNKAFVTVDTMLNSIKTTSNFANEETNENVDGTFNKNINSDFNIKSAEVDLKKINQ